MQNLFIYEKLKYLTYSILTQPQQCAKEIKYMEIHKIKTGLQVLAAITTTAMISYAPKALAETTEIAQPIPNQQIELLMACGGVEEITQDQLLSYHKQVLNMINGLIPIVDGTDHLYNVELSQNSTLSIRVYFDDESQPRLYRITDTSPISGYGDIPTFGYVVQNGVPELMTNTSRGGCDELVPLASNETETQISYLKPSF